ncbi:uncharacterized mitochondrial protein-like protein [Tanacetum coccineum]
MAYNSSSSNANSKDETSEILKRFIKEIEILVDKKVKIIRSDNGIEFKNKVMDDFRREKGIRENHSVSYDPQQILCCSVNGEEEIEKKFNYSDVKSASTPVDLEKSLVKDGVADDIDVHLYRSMIGYLMYLTESRPDILFMVCACARFQVTPKTSHLLAVKRIFRHLKGKPTLGLWYSRDSPFKLVAYTDSYYTGATLDRKSTTGGWIRTRLGISIEVGTPRYLSPVAPLTKVGDEAVHKELGDRMERAAATASSLEAEQDSGSGPRCQDTILGDVNAQTRLELVLYVFVFAVKRMLMMPVQVSAVEEKPKESDGFAEIIDFLKASSVSYALTVNPVIYTSCIEQFWATAKVQTVNGVRQLQALVDKKKVTVTESSIRRDLHLDDAEGTDCLPTATIFEELARMGYEKPSQKLTFYKAFFSPQWKYFIHTITQCLSAKSTAWNEFSSSMASLIICLATNQKFNLSKYIFDAMVKHLDGGVKFLMYPRFLQVFINQQLGNMSTHKKIFVNPFHTKKVFANMKRAGKDFSGRITPLFDTMMVQPVEEMDSRKLVLSRRVESSEDKESLVAPEDASKQGEVLQILMMMLSTTGEAITTASVKDSAAPTTIEEITLAQTLIQIKAAKPKVVTTAARTTTTTRPKAKRVVVQEPSEFRVPQEEQPLISKDKGKGITIPPEVPLKIKDQIALDEQIARDIQAKLIVLPEELTNQKEREELTDEEKGKLFMELMEKRRKHFAALRAQEKRNRPPTKAQRRTQMSTYLKHMGGYTYKQLKGKSFDEIQKLFNKEIKRVNTFVDMGSEVHESKEKKVEGSEETTKRSRKKMLGRKRAIARILKEIKNGGRQRVR